MMGASWPQEPFRVLLDGSMPSPSQIEFPRRHSNDYTPTASVNLGAVFLPLRNGNLIRLMLMDAAANLARDGLQESRPWRR